MDSISSLALTQDINAGPVQLTTGPVAITKPKPTISQLRAACDAFNVKGTARALAFELLSYWAPGGTVFPSVATLAAGLGLKPRMVQYHMKRLERIGLWSRHGRTGTTNIYELRLPGGVQPQQQTDGSKVDTTRVGGAMGCMGGCNPLHPEVTTEVTKKYVQRKRCAVCGNSWPERFGNDCFRCLKKRDTPKPKRPNRMARADDGWFNECTRLHGGLCNGSRGHRLAMQDAAGQESRIRAERGHGDEANA